MDAVTRPPTPVNEPVLAYEPGTPERERLEKRLAEIAGEPIDLPMTIGGSRRLGRGASVPVLVPHRRTCLLGGLHEATVDDVDEAITAARQAAPAWRALSADDRAAIFLRAANLLTGPWRATMLAATMLGQSKTAYQAEIDAVCELVDAWRFNVHFARQILEGQAISSAGAWNRIDYRPLEGFVLAITPFNFTSIAANLPTAPALMGNVVVWKPAVTQQVAAHVTMRLLEEAGLPPGVINLVTGSGAAVSERALADPDLAGVHFTGSTVVFRSLWRRVAQNLDAFRGYPRLVGETGGKGFVLAHPSADPEVLRSALVRGAFEYQGQKCSAASRAYLPRSLWRRLRDQLVAETEALRMGDVADPDTFLGAVIDARAYSRLSDVLERIRGDDSLNVLAGGSASDEEGYFVRPTLVLGDDPGHEVFSTEYFGPILAVYVYEDSDFDTVLRLVDQTSLYGLTGAIVARDRAAIARASEALRFAAGNLYLNDKPTGAVIAQQPFGGGRASGTNDKAGSALNLLRWVSPRAIKETFTPPPESIAGVGQQSVPC